jgi:hypothetical protein
VIIKIVEIEGTTFYPPSVNPVETLIREQLRQQWKKNRYYNAAVKTIFN